MGQLATVAYTGWRPPHHPTHLSEHDCGVAVEEGNAGQTLAALEALDDHGLARLEDDLRHLVCLEHGGLVELLASGLLADLPVDLGHAARGAAAADEADGGVPSLDLTGDVQGLKCGKV